MFFILLFVVFNHFIYGYNIFIKFERGTNTLPFIIDIAVFVSIFGYFFMGIWYDD